MRNWKPCFNKNFLQNLCSKKTRRNPSEQRNQSKNRWIKADSSLEAAHVWFGHQPSLHSQGKLSDVNNGGLNLLETLFNGHDFDCEFASNSLLQCLHTLARYTRHALRVVGAPVVEFFDWCHVIKVNFDLIKLTKAKGGA